MREFRPFGYDGVLTIHAGITSLSQFSYDCVDEPVLNKSTRFVWIARGMSLAKRVRHVEERWAYYFAFGELSFHAKKARTSDNVSLFRKDCHPRCFACGVAR